MNKKTAKAMPSNESLDIHILVYYEPGLWILLLRERGHIFLFEIKI